MSNAEQIEYWNGKAGETWVRMQERMDHALTPVTSALLSLAAPQPGESILDIGCGGGETTLALAVAAGEDGIVIGIDISEPLLARARARATELLSDAEFRSADASTFVDASDGFDLLVSRFGVMFFDAPVAAFTNLFRLARPGARLCFACWQSPGDNLWATLPLQLLADVLPPQPSSDPHAPGPFAFADPEYAGAVLAEAGWQNISFDAMPFGMVMGEGDDPVAAAVQFALRIGPAARAVRDAGPDAEAIAQIRLAKAFGDHLANGQVALPATVWLVSAEA